VFDVFSTPARSAVTQANQEARTHGNDYTGIEHLRSNEIPKAFGPSTITSQMDYQPSSRDPSALASIPGNHGLAGAQSADRAQLGQRGAVTVSP
jgi:hypothetical protein